MEQNIIGWKDIESFVFGTEQDFTELLCIINLFSELSDTQNLDQYHNLRIF